jgi:hypothetical protein
MKGDFGKVAAAKAHIQRSIEGRGYFDYAQTSAETPGKFCLLSADLALSGDLLPMDDGLEYKIALQV